MNQYLHLLIAIAVLLAFHFGMRWLRTKTRHPFGRTIHLFIHRWFGGSVRRKIPWKKDRQRNYPRLANWFVSTVFIGIALSWTPYWVVPAWFGVGLALVFAYMFHFGLNLEEWYECYRDYWKTKGYALWFPYPDSMYEYQTHFVTLKKGAISWGNISREEAIQKFFFEIYGKYPSFKQ